MLLRRFYDEKLAQASYLVGCTATGEALVVDPNRSVDQYLEEAERQALRITHVSETHIHADFVSGTRELAHRTAASMLLSAEGGADWQYGFAAEDGAVLLRGGDHFMVGNVRIDVLHTPGHTPEHLSFLVTDTASADQPMGVFTGDFLFVGDVGRPDLLERAAGFTGTMEAGARTLFRSTQAFKSMPDHLQIWPGHGAGSACGKALGGVPQSTLGYEKLFNWALAEQGEDEFVRTVLAGQPEPPTYFAEMKRLNKEGPRLLGGFGPPARLPAARLPELLDEEALVVDARPAADYAVAHARRTINIPLNQSFNTWAGWLIPHGRGFYLIVDDERCPSCPEEAVKDLAMIGLDQLVGYFGSDAIRTSERDGIPGTVHEITPAELAERLSAGGVTVIDVRGRSEWEAGHLPGAPNIPLGYLRDRLGTIPRDKPIVVHCQTGARSAIAASVLKAEGVEDVLNLTGGFHGWQSGGHPVSRTDQ
jgi:hydroxyacylglutathione hydrolase